MYPKLGFLTNFKRAFNPYLHQLSKLYSYDSPYFAIWSFTVYDILYSV
jgi:hypothetical protein